MDYSQPFFALNERLRPRVTSSDKLYTSLTRLDSRQWYSARVLPSTHRQSILPTNPEPALSAPAAEPEEPEEAGRDAAQGALTSSDLQEEGGCCADPRPFGGSCFAELTVKDEEGEEQSDEDGGAPLSGEKDSSGDASPAAAGEGGSSLQRSYLDGTLPDLIRSGRPLGRRRTLGQVTDTLKEVRREVELSRRRSIKLKAQVDRLQEGREGPGWSQHRERVTEQVLSVLRLLHPLTEREPGPAQVSPGENQLDAALAQLQTVARKLAIGCPTQSKPGVSTEDSAVFQQALKDRDEAIEKKKAMETELLRSKTEMMLLNNQLLEAAQKRLELSLELEAWKEDVQLILQQQVQQQQAEQAQKKSSRVGILRRHNKPPMQQPASAYTSTPAAPRTNSSQIFISKAAVSAAPSTPKGTWRDKLRKGKSSRQAEQPAAEQASQWDGGFQVVSLD